MNSFISVTIKVNAIKFAENMNYNCLQIILILEFDHAFCCPCKSI